jgi:hypothetical protein
MGNDIGAKDLSPLPTFFHSHVVHSDMEAGSADLIDPNDLTEAIFGTSTFGAAKFGK